MLYALTETNPLERFWDLRRDFDRLFTEAFPFQEPDNSRGAFVPALELEEDDDGLTMHVEVPGVEPDKLNVSVNGHVLTVGGERTPTADDNGNLQRSERRFGKFSRSVHLPEHYDSTGIAASHEHGILTLRIPKSAAAKPRNIKIESK
jgi:HSP20 family protein